MPLVPKAVMGSPVFASMKTSHQPALARIRPSDRTDANPRASEVDAAFIGAIGGGTFTPTPPAGYTGTGQMDGLSDVHGKRGPYQTGGTALG